MFGQDFGGVGADIIGEMLVGLMGDQDDEATQLANIISGVPDSYPVVGADIIGAAIAAAKKKAAPRSPANVAALVRSAQNAAMLKKAQQALLARAVNPHAVEYRETSYSRSGELILPMGNTSVPAGTTVNITFAPQVPIQITKMFIPSTTGVLFGLVDARVGKDSQYIAAGEVPCEVFSEVSVDSNVRFDTCAVGQSVILTVRNKDAVNAQTFSGMMRGNVVLR